MTIRLYDTMAREKRAFEPADPSRVTMYVCGPTVYNRAHIGTARPAVVFDVIARVLRPRYGAANWTSRVQGKGGAFRASLGGTRILKINRTKSYTSNRN